MSGFLNNLLSKALIIGLLHPLFIHAQISFNVEGRWAYGIQEELIFHPSVDTIGYLSCGANLLTLDFTDPADPTEISKMTFDPIIYHFVQTNNHLFVVGPSKLNVVDILNPTEPTLVNSIPIPGNGRRVYHHGDLLYIPGSKTLVILNVSDPANPSLEIEFEMADPLRDMTFFGNYVYGGTSNSEQNWIVIIDLSDFPNLKDTTWAVSDAGYTNTVAVIDSLLYVGGLDSLFILDLHDPWAPVRDTALQTGWIYDISYLDTVAFFTHQGHGTSLYNITNPETPHLLSKLRQWASWITYQAPFAYALSNGGGRTHIHNIGDVESPILLDEIISFGDNSSDLLLLEDLVYLPLSNSIEILDASDPADLLHRSSIDLSRTIKFVRQGDFVYTSNRWAGWSVLDVSEATHPILINQIDTVARAEDLTIDGDFLYLADWQGGVRIYDITDPLTIREMSQVKTSGDIEHLIKIDSFIYAYQRRFGLLIIDVSNPSTPVVIDSISFAGSIQALGLYQNYLYVGINGNTKILDVTDAANPVDQGQTLFWQAVQNITVFEDRLYLSSGRDGAVLFDLSDPVNPTQMGAFAIPAAVKAIKLNGDLIYVLDQNAGLYIITLDSTVTASNNQPKLLELVLSPNPVIHQFSIKIPHEFLGSNAQMLIHDAKGQFMRQFDISIHREIMMIDASSWSSGAYYMILKNEDQFAWSKFVKL